MAHSLGITVVAEGIETEGQYAVLRERGCDQGQGFWLGRPMSNEDFLRKLQEN
jgi:EAL domain-containing protein (putative c-di-GMP-specific phosphodiesterase class I)